MLLACAAFLAVGQSLVGPPHRPLPDLAVVAATALLPLAIGLRIVRMPGAAVAICGAFLLPASLISLLQPSIEPPPLLLIPALGFELVLWLRFSHLASIRGLWTRTQPWRRKRTTTKSELPGSRHAALAGAVFGAILAVVEPPFRVFLGGDPATWSTPSALIVAPITALACGVIATVVRVRGRAS
jgi:hypothetical protein